MQPVGQDLLRSCAFSKYTIFTVPCIPIVPEPHLSFTHMIYIETYNMHLLHYNNKGSVVWIVTTIQYSSNPGWIQIWEQDPVLVNNTQLVTKRNHTNKQKNTTSNFRNKAFCHYDFQAKKLLWDNRRLTMENKPGFVSNCPVWGGSKEIFI